MGRFETHDKLVFYVNDGMGGLADAVVFELPSEEDAIITANFLNEINASPPVGIKLH
jgi:hypothetical protein